MIPNRFQDNPDDAPEYNTIDASLWLFIALYRYDKKFIDPEFIRWRMKMLESMLAAHIEGTRFGIKVSEHGFLGGGSGADQLTWMDARAGNYAVTPRQGYPVEIQALWYNAIRIFLDFSARFMDRPPKLEPVLKRLTYLLEENFRSRFLGAEGYLNDVIHYDGTADTALRSNQIYALSLPYPLVDSETGRQIFRRITRELFTPYGLRSLSTDHPDFKPTYEGDPWNRDTAYHQGTVWPFLLIEYFQAWLSLYGRNTAFKKNLVEVIETLKSHFYEAECIHGVSEIFDGLRPGAGKGTVHQAWSVSALLQLVQLSRNS